MHNLARKVSDDNKAGPCNAVCISNLADNVGSHDDSSPCGRRLRTGRREGHAQRRLRLRVGRQEEQRGHVRPVRVARQAQREPGGRTRCAARDGHADDAGHRRIADGRAQGQERQGPGGGEEDGTDDGRRREDHGQVRRRRSVHYPRDAEDGRGDAGHAGDGRRR